MDPKRKAQIVYDREVLCLSYRSLGEKYGVNPTAIFQMIKIIEKKRAKEKEAQPGEEVILTIPGDEKALRNELRKARLKIELLNSVIDISSKELGIDLRKKRGTRQS